MKLLEGDRQITEMVQAQLGEQWPAVHAILMQHEDAILAIAGGRYEWIGRMVRAAVTQPRAGQLTLTDRIDRVATHPLWGMLILLGILGVLFWLTYALGTPLQTWLDVHLVQAGSVWAQGAAARGTGLADRAGGQRDHRRRGHGADLAAGAANLLRRAGHPGRPGLHGAGSLCDGPLYAPDGLAREKLSALIPGFWLQRAGSDGGAQH